jgi:hypothetical protein
VSTARATGPATGLTAKPVVQRSMPQKTDGAGPATAPTGAAKAGASAPNTREFLLRVLPWPKDGDERLGYCNTHVMGTGSDGKKFWSGTPCLGHSEQ